MTTKRRQCANKGIANERKTIWKKKMKIKLNERKESKRKI